MTGPDAGLLELLRCPRCADRLTAVEVGLRCVACDHPLSRIGSSYVSFPDPDAVVSGWRDDLAGFIAATATMVGALATQPGSTAPALTRDRVERVRRGLIDRCDRVRALFEQAGISPAAGPTTSGGSAGRNRILSYYHHIHRDWGWEPAQSQETEIAVDLVMQMLQDERLETAIVLGAGACRLPYELHRGASLQTTLAVDINPLPFFVARRVIDGQTVRLPELPATPRSSEFEVVDRDLRCPGPTPAGFELLFANGLEPPVANGAFDLVVTPWFIDQVPTDVATLLPQIHRMLRPGGVWVNHGPLIYHPARTSLSHRYRTDELLSLVASAGFAIEADRWDRLLYLQSPAGSQGRLEGVLSFRARALGQPGAQ